MIWRKLIQPFKAVGIEADRRSKYKTAEGAGIYTDAVRVVVHLFLN